MKVLIISQCTKRAAVETCRIVDQFAERFGDRTWQTQITQQGLKMLRTLLKRTARRNTAVACHWMRSRNHTELLWIVGNATCFGERGTVPTNFTKKSLLPQHEENDWHTLQDIKIMASIAALFHDFGKSSQAFQHKLMDKNKKLHRDPYRHEWISLRLFQAFVGESKNDHDWLSRLAALANDNKNFTQNDCLMRLKKDGVDEINPLEPNIFVSLPTSLSKAIGWLILTHHFLPYSNHFDWRKASNLLNHIDPEWNNAQFDADQKVKQACWKITLLPFSSKAWRKHASYWGNQALQRKQLMEVDWLKDLFSLHIARLSLMWADHFYSNEPAHNNLGDQEFSLFANTDRDKNLKQRLDEHLIGVTKYTKRIIKSLPRLQQNLPRIAQHRGFRQRAKESQFSWQNQAYDLVCSLREKSIQQGFFGINMASTGSGKTLANGRIMYGLANPNLGARFIIALGLRTLTLQTGNVYRKQLKLDEEDLAILIGSSAIKELFEMNQEEMQHKEQAVLARCGSESAEELISDHIIYEGSYDIEILNFLFQKNPSLNKLLSAPLLVCTVDHLVGATEGIRGGRQIAPMLRLLTSDLILDELDDFDVQDLPALSRLVHWAGLLGSRVLLSSATLPPAIVQSLFNAYYAGRTMFHKSRGAPESPIKICCAWFHEHSVIASDHAETDSFLKMHYQFAGKQIERLQKTVVYRRAVIKQLDINTQNLEKIYPQLAQRLLTMSYELHQCHHNIDSMTRKKISFGLIRIANIDPLIHTAENLFKLDAQENYRVIICCYHARHPLLVRDTIEKDLDRLLDRRDETAIFKDKKIRDILNRSKENNIIFLVIASPVAEVGRDHDYDWAIAEPSSMRSIIQLAGRVNRHRKKICVQPNVYLLSTNIKSLTLPIGYATYCKPGFELQGNDQRFLLLSHDLNKILLPEQYETITAEARIRERENLSPRQNLVDLEHTRLQAKMLEQESGITANLWWEGQTALTGELQRKTPFRQSQKQVRYVLLPNEKFKGELVFHELESGKPCNNMFIFYDLEKKDFPTIEAWINKEYLTLLTNLAEKKKLEVNDCGRRYGWLDLNDEGLQRWCYNHVLGLRRENK